MQWTIRFTPHDTHGNWTVSDENETVCYVLDHDKARLIAAAPAMLEALLDALPYVEDVLSDPAALACFKPGTVERHAKAIRAAIAAATKD